MSEFNGIIEVLIHGVEGFGVLVIVVGSLAATARFLLELRRAPMADAYTTYRHGVARAIILGLEFLIAGDVIRTVIVTHTLTNVAVLALIIVLRAFLSWSLTLEIEGRWPWQPRSRDLSYLRRQIADPNRATPRRLTSVPRPR